MENFKEKLKIQNLIITVCCIILALFIILSALGEAEIIPFFQPMAGDSHWRSAWRGFISGGAGGILALMISGLIRNIRALRSEKVLKKLYVQENDERTLKIWTLSRASATQTFLLVGLAAAIVAGYFSITVSITIIACILVHSLFCIAYKFYYNKKF